MPAFAGMSGAGEFGCDLDRCSRPACGKMVLDSTAREFAARISATTKHLGGVTMRKALLGILAAAAVQFSVGSASAQNTIKIGIILPYSGQFADGAAQMDNAIKLYVQQNGDTVAGKKLEFIRQDTG